MPLKIILLISFLWISGLGLGGWLFLKSLRSLSYRLIFFGFCALTYWLCYTYIPCFSGGVVCSVKEKQELALTFDDGPQEPYTSQVLDILKEENIHATFFVLGKYVQNHPDLIQRMIDEGHVVGNHGWSHTPLAFQGKNFIRHEIDSWEDVMRPFGLLPYKLFRASHGWKNPALVKILNEKKYRFIGWNVGVWDSDKPQKEVLMERLEGLSPGSIILLHDGDGDHEGGDRSQTVAVLPDLIHKYKKLGFQFVTIPEILK
ncbi:MAG: polysaccharide deacetylase family protein [Deltaproteobacteria bacterium]|nr:MAG: polysaccharide deacetylase family protein [Deltaproteobacteria bacterium]